MKRCNTANRPIPFPRPRTQTQKFLDSFCIASQGGVAVACKETNKVIGYILFKEAQEGVYEMGWFFNRNTWGRGYALESCKAVIAYAFETNPAKP